MTDAVLKAVEAVAGTDLGAIQVLQGTTPVKIAKSTIVDVNGNPISFAVLDVVGPGPAAAAQRVHLSNEALAALEQITATVSGPIALDSATLAALETINIGNFPASQGVNLTQVNGAAHSGGNPLFADITDRIARILGTAKAQQDGSWTVALDAPTLAALETISVGNFPTNQAVNIASGAGTAAATPLFSQEVVGGAAVSITNPVPTRNVPADLAVQAQGAAAAAVTLTIPAAGAGLFHYIDVIEIHLYSTAARTGAAAPVSVSSTNLPGNMTTLFPTAGAIGTIDRYAYSGDRPIKSAAANTATTIVCPAVTGGLWHVKVVYSAGP